MVNRSVVKKALRIASKPDEIPEMPSVSSVDDRSCEISMLIFDIFGGEILKTHCKKGWHFYNRINGKRIDFAGSEVRKSSGYRHFEDIPSSIDEINNYFEKEDYSTFFMRFIRAFEETVGLKKFKRLSY